MKGKKKEIIFSLLLFLLLAGFIVGGIILMRRSATNQTETKQTKIEAEEDQKTENDTEKMDGEAENNDQNKMQNKDCIQEEDQEQEKAENGEDDEDVTPAIEGELPKAWDYVEEDDTLVVLSGKQLLEGIIPEEKLNILESELLTFLKENQEYRREVIVEEYSLKDADDKVCFYGKFQNPRTDRKKIYVVYNKAAQSYQFSLQKEE